MGVFLLGSRALVYLGERELFWRSLITMVVRVLNTCLEFFAHLFRLSGITRRKWRHNNTKSNGDISPTHEIRQWIEVGNPADVKIIPRFTFNHGETHRVEQKLNSNGTTRAPFRRPLPAEGP
jgi:hypothetical protein